MLVLKLTKQIAPPNKSVKYVPPPPRNKKLADDPGRSNHPFYNPGSATEDGHLVLSYFCRFGCAHTSDHMSARTQVCFWFFTSAHLCIPCDILTRRRRFTHNTNNPKVTSARSYYNWFQALAITDPIRIGRLFAMGSYSNQLHFYRQPSEKQYLKKNSFM